jgi:hypothetical protein
VRKSIHNSHHFARSPRARRDDASLARISARGLPPEAFQFRYDSCVSFLNEEVKVSIFSFFPKKLSRNNLLNLAQNFFRPARRRVLPVLLVSAGSANATRRKKGKPNIKVIP